MACILSWNVLIKCAYLSHFPVKCASWVLVVYLIFVTTSAVSECIKICIVSIVIHR